MSDSTLVKIIVGSVEPVFTSIGTKEYLRLYIRCSDPPGQGQNPFLIAIVTPHVLESPKTEVGIRFDGGRPRYERWTVNKGGTTVQTFNADKRKNFLSDLQKYKKLVFQWQRHNAEFPTEASFDISKLSSFLKRGEADGCDFS